MSQAWAQLVADGPTTPLDTLGRRAIADLLETILFAWLFAGAL